MCLELENKIHLKEKEIDKLSSSSSYEKAQAKTDLYLQILDELSQKDKGFTLILAKIKNGLASAVRDIKKETDLQSKKTDEDKSELT